MGDTKGIKIWSWIADNSEERADVAILKAIETHQGQITDSLQNPTDLPSLTRSQLKRLMEEGQVTANGKTIKPNQKLKQKTLVQIVFPSATPTELIPENRPIEILFEDSHLVIINKPPGLTVHPSSTQMEGTLVHALLHHIQDLSGIGGVLRPGIVHRIDKDTSGALVITKTDAAHQKLSKIFAKHEIDRCYWAICYGTPPGHSNDKSTKIESLIGRNPTDRKKMSMKVKEGRNAITYYKKLREFSIPGKKPFAAFLEVTLETGRTHQVRVHMTGIGHSLLGDPVYGTPTENQPKWQALPQEIKKAVQLLPGQALHARVLGFEHPITGEKLRFEAEPPEGFKLLLEKLTQEYG